MSDIKTVKRKTQANSSVPPEQSDPLDLSPHSVEAEEAVLGALLLNPSAFWDVQPHLEADDFFILGHEWIYDAMSSIVSRSDMGLDTRTLAEILRQRGKLDDVGGEGYLNYLYNVVPTAANAEVYAMLVERAAVRRRLLGAAGEIAQMAHNEERDTEDVLNDSQRAVMDVAFRKTATKTIHIGTAAGELYDKYEKARANKTDIIGITSPFYDIDSTTGGWQPSWLILVGGRPGMGKTSFVLQCALHAAKKGKEGKPAHIAFFSSEMDYEQIVARGFAQEHGVPTKSQRRMNDAQWAKFVDFTDEVSRMPMYINDTSGLTPMQIARECREQMRINGSLDMVFVDYLQDYKADRSDRRFEKKHEEVAEIAQALKNLARELRIPVMAAVQLNRDCEKRANKMPLLSDLAESDKLGQAADVVLYPFRDGYYTADPNNPQKSDNVVDCNFAKFRHGDTPTVALLWNGPATRFDNPAREHNPFGK